MSEIKDLAKKKQINQQRNLKNHYDKIQNRQSQNTTSQNANQFVVTRFIYKVQQI